VRLYSDEQGAGGDIVDAPVGTANSTQLWPFAIEYQEIINEGPECYRYVNGAETEAVEVKAGVGGDCVCEYANFGLG